MKDTQAIFTKMLEAKATNTPATAKKVVETKTAKKASFVKQEAAGHKVTGCLLRESDESKDIAMGDVIDNIQVITDPDKTVDELEKRADEIQDAIDGSEEGEAAFSDEYVGDKVYACPVCGESFFADENYKEGDKCPICNAEPTDGFLLQGVVAAVEDTEENDEDFEDFEEPEDADEEKPEEDAEELEDADEEEPATEACAKKAKDADEKREKAMEARRRIAARRRRMEAAAKKECEAPSIEVTLNVAADDASIGKKTAPECLSCELDEDSFEDALNDFADENYSDAVDEIEVTDACYNPESDELVLNCEAKCRGNKKVPMQFRMKESKHTKGRSVLLAREAKNAFRIDESKGGAPFKFAVVRKGNKIACESLSYRYTTTHKTAGKVQVEGLHRVRAKSEAKRPSFRHR